MDDREQRNAAELALLDPETRRRFLEARALCEAYDSGTLGSALYGRLVAEGRMDDAQRILAILAPRPIATTATMAKA